MPSKHETSDKIKSFIRYQVDTLVKRTHSQAVELARETEEAPPRETPREDEDIAGTTPLEG